MNHGRTSFLPRLGRVAVALCGRVVTVCRRVGFWGAVVLPIFYVPLLAGGITSRLQWIAFVGLLTLHLLALLVGHGYNTRTIADVEAGPNKRLIADGGSEDRSGR